MRRPITRRVALSTLAGGASLAAAPRCWSQAASSDAVLDVTFVFTNDIHACRMGEGLSPNCAEEGKTDANLLRHIAGINNVSAHDWPREIGGAVTGLASAGAPHRCAARGGRRRRHDR